MKPHADDRFQLLWSDEQWTGLPVHRSILSPLMFLERTLRVFPEKTGIVDGDRRLTYAAFGARVYRLANALRRQGVEPGDRVAILCRNASEMLDAHFGVPQIGAILVPINVRLTSDEIAYILDHSGARALILDAELTPLIAPIRTQLNALEVIVVADVSSRHAGSLTDAGTLPDGVDYEEFLKDSSPEPFAYPVDDEDHPISINYTSGTTGRPKGVIYTHRGAYLNALGEIIEVGLRPDSTYLWTLPMYHCNGWCFPWAVTGIGATHVCLPKVDAARVLSLIEAEQVRPLLRRTDGADHAGDGMPAGVSFCPPVDRRDGGSPTAASNYSADGRIGGNDYSRIWADRNLRTAYGLRVEARMGWVVARRTRPPQSAPGCRLPARTGTSCGGRGDARCPGGRRHPGGGGDARQQCDEGLLP
jgi:fatty-acyl-CoA synthase